MRQTFYIRSLVMFSFSLVFTLALLVLIGFVPEQMDQSKWAGWWAVFIVCFSAAVYSGNRLDKVATWLRHSESDGIYITELEKRNKNQLKALQNAYGHVGEIIEDVESKRSGDDTAAKAKYCQCEHCIEVRAKYTAAKGVGYNPFDQM